MTEPASRKIICPCCKRAEHVVIVAAVWRFATAGDRWRYDCACRWCAMPFEADAPGLADRPPPPHRRNYGHPIRRITL